MKHHKALEKVCDVKRVRAFKARRTANRAAQEEREALAALQAVIREKEHYVEAAQTYIDNSLAQGSQGQMGALEIRAVSSEYRDIQLMAEYAGLREADHIQSHGQARSGQQEQQQAFLKAQHRYRQLGEMLAQQQEEARDASERRADDEITDLITARGSADGTR